MSVLQGHAPIALKSRSSNTALAFAPYRVSFAGGGTDLLEFFDHNRGSVVSFTLTIGVHVFASSLQQKHHNILTADEHFIGADIEKIQNRLLRQCINRMDGDGFIKLAGLGDLAHGSGMGSSGSFSVSVLLALSALAGTPLSARDLAETAYLIERHELDEKVGKQDQYAAAFGGLNHISFERNAVEVNPILISQSDQNHLQDHMMLLATGNRRKAGAILREMSKTMSEQSHNLIEMRDYADALASTLAKSNFEVSEIGRILNANWKLKRGLSQQISNSSIDAMHEIACTHGALGAKLLGAGSGGYMLILAPPDRHVKIKEALGNPQQQPCLIGAKGAHLIGPGSHSASDTFDAQPASG